MTPLGKALGEAFEELVEDLRCEFEALAPRTADGGGMRVF
jgi:hypothetical protein